jgi:hypothetical protein
MLPFIPIRRPALIKPPFGTPINFAHPLAKNLVGFWLFNEGGGTTVKDNVNGTNNGVIQKLGASTNTSWVPTPYGIGLKNDTTSSGNGIQLTNAIVSGTTFTIEVLLNWTLGSGATYGNLCTQGPTRGLWTKGNGGTQFHVDFADPGDNLNTTLLNANQWYHAILSVNAGAGIWYINGKADGTVAAIATSSFDGILCDKNGTTGGEQFVGQVAYERIWVGRAITANEAQQLYFNPFDMLIKPRPAIIRRKAVAGGNVYNNSLSENFTLTDSQNFLGSMNPATSEAVALADGYAGSMSSLPSVIENVSLSDLATAGFAYNFTLTETLVLSDTQTLGIIIPFSVLETIFLTDNAVGRAIQAATDVETLIFTDQPAIAMSVSYALSEAIALSDLAVISVPAPPVVITTPAGRILDPGAAPRTLQAGSAGRILMLTTNGRNL